ncbi:hypothetical protein [Chitinophaga sp.]|uniref:hypothetical protein n=1 Tax=Chitinophaga sp. TaxID=1869181 RepID=UPI0031DF462E
MAWNLFGQEDIRLQVQEGKKGYEMKMETDLTMGNTSFTSAIFYRWEVFLHKNTADSYHLSLLTLEHSLLENSSPALADIYMATKTMMEMFSELQLVTDKSGRIKEVSNMEAVRTKFERVSKQPLSFSGGVTLRADQVYNVPLSDITTEEKLIKRVQAMEFFDIFFGSIYGVKVPGSFYRERLNYLRNLPYHLKLKVTTGDVPGKGPEQVRAIAIQGNNVPVSEKEITKALGSLPFVAGHPLKFDASFMGSYAIDNKTGWLQHAEIMTSEFVAPTLQGRTKYTINAL